MKKVINRLSKITMSCLFFISSCLLFCGCIPLPKKITPNFFDYEAVWSCDYEDLKLSVTTRGKDASYSHVLEGTLVLNGEEMEVIMAVHQSSMGLSLYKRPDNYTGPESWVEFKRDWDKETMLDWLIFVGYYTESIFYKSITVDIEEEDQAVYSTGATEYAYLCGRELVLERQ